MNRIIMIIILMLLTACSSIPLTTMVSMAGFDEHDFVALSPQEILVRIELNEPLHVDLANVSSIQASIDTPEGRLPFSFALMTAQGEHLVSQKGWFASDEPVYRQVLSLSDQGRRAFSEFQALVGEQQVVSVDVSVRVDIKEQMQRLQRQSMVLSLALQLSAEQGYIVILDGHDIALEDV